MAAREPTGREHLTPVRIKDTSATERAGFRRCRRQWFLTVVHRLDSQEGNVNFFTGTLYHRGLQVYYEQKKAGASHDDATIAALDAYQDLFDTMMDEVKEDLGFFWQYGESAFREAGELGFEMVQNYLEQEGVNPLLDEIIAVEFRVRVPIPHPKTGRRTGWLSVQADLVGRKDGELVVVDHKTASREPNIGHLDIDDQLTAEVYSWFGHSGEFPTRAIYNVGLKRAPGPPKLIRKGKALSKDKSQGTTYQLYREAIREHGFDVADYLDILEYLKEREERGEDQFFQRNETFRSPEQIAAFERDLYQEFRDMKAVAADPARAYPNPSPFNCPGCPVRTICFTIQDGGDVEAIIKGGFVVADPRR